MASSIDGIASGLQTKALIDQLMQVEARPQTLLKAKVTTTQGLVTTLQQLNTRLSSLTELATKTAKPEALDLYKAISSGDAAKATASASALPGSLDFTVKQLAQSQSSVTAAMTSFSAEPTTLTLRTAGGASTEISTTGTLDDVVAAVMKANVGITATKVAAGKDADGVQQYRLQFTAKEPGAENGFSVFRGTADDVTAKTATDLFAGTDAATVRTAKDAELVLWGGTAAEQTVASSSNTFADLLPGVAVTVSKVSADPVSVTIAGDADGTSKVAKDLVDSLRSALSFIAMNTAVTPGITATAKPTAGKFTGDSAVRSIAQSVLSAATAPINGRSTAEMGISLTRTGTVEFDETKFAAALAANPGQVKDALTQLSTRVAEAGKSASDKFDGDVTKRIQSQEASIRSMNDRVTDWGRSLDKRRATMERTYAALEVTLSKMQAQGDWLSSQLANIPSRSN
ncbi:flagellar filament capping protein FliD [Arthrobacter agilis]|uniref:flagellar filament capping protein FliD n=1 Tax=Arthrobacter agilis TaxID=37921 RepID=UPI0023668553|nr:flagellar filament capping protein FliD [Arthrobacter agilis]WDF33756.1 flagellar filament capping protein FliD [Arthrobacter agilis]